MADEQADSSGGGRAAREAQRFTLLLRVVKLIADGREYLAVLRDVSASGARLRLFHVVPAAAQYALVVDGSKPHAMQLSWVRGDHAGFRFAQPVDVAALLHTDGETAGDGHERGTGPRRQIRLDIEMPVFIHSEGMARVGTLHNISLTGAAITCEQPLRLYQPVRLEPRGRREVLAQVWRCRHPRYGVLFDEPFALPIGARYMARLHGAAGETFSLRPNADATSPAG